MNRSITVINKANTKLDELRSLVDGFDLPPRYKVKTFGCQMNERDSEAIRSILESAGFSEAESGDADLYVFNTCCVRERAEWKALGNISALGEYKKNHPSTIICVCGCMMQQPDAAEELKRQLPFVDIIFGTGNLDRLPELLINAINGRKSIIVEEPVSVIEGLHGKRKGRISSFVNIMFGCDNFCSYCIVPFVRGRERSRYKQDILDEICRLVESGTREVVLLGQNVNSYGKQHGETFAGILRDVALIDGLFRIRFMTSHPKDLSDDLIDMIAYEPKVCTQIHLPLQSGSDKILGAMNRGYTLEQYMERVSLLRERAHMEAGLSTDIIVGFPGETDEDYRQTLSAVRELNFTSAYMFAYSKRNNTKAALMDGHVDETVKNERLKELISIQDEITKKHNLEYVGRIVPVLAEGPSKRGGALSGKTDCGRTVIFNGTSIDVGSIVDVEIETVKGHVLEGVRV